MNESGRVRKELVGRGAKEGYGNESFSAADHSHVKSSMFTHWQQSGNSPELKCSV